MTGWQNFDYVITSAPNQCPFEIANSGIVSRVEMSPRTQWIAMADADALLIVLNDAQGLEPSEHHNVFLFTDNRPNFDGWMAAHHRGISYVWLDQFVVAFADRAARLSFNDDLGERVLRAAPLPRQAASPPSAPTRQ
ncbi:MAG: hypothetical protein A2790_07720 [Phenylobacterium sp. RIFCSPHIGHO2_01_FULL_69_31]|uniref:hypothetical protein n=1 Tax=Phenylobacterium sp. RIFCSPHIGHO2_01_FULL_69_31 TaxID=1801944 RepID=UPI0008BC44D0|nr:hypothetical protein [Phenylobacterium sp. RIFCSPHIGHO2_01_FULL_69_31]OHB29776.1 MAG: hypothetical protein A2790_07720 [Phenylobacterium sp. RIFCSPHIGHO2_01_FULL_69_31]